jgi:chromatin-remodeling ATPase INO80
MSVDFLSSDSHDGLTEFIFQVQDIVVGNKTFTDVAKPSEIVQLLLNEDHLTNLDASNGLSDKTQGRRPPQGDPTGSSVRDLWAEEGDEFFGSSNTGEQGKEEDGISTPPVTSRGRGRRKGPGTESTRGRGRSRVRGRGKKSLGTGSP